LVVSLPLPGGVRMGYMDLTVIDCTVFLTAK
jgi:hypothetical protein